MLPQAQTNITLLNRVVWGVCNAPLSEAQCVANMGWFATSLQASCASDLNDRNTVVSSTLTGSLCSLSLPLPASDDPSALQSFKLMHDAGCLVNQGTNVYCYVEAAFNTNPSDLYFYQLPLGIALPNTTKSTCSGCTKTMLGLFAAALGDSSQADRLRALRSTYPPAARLANTECGQGYAAVSPTGGAVGALMRPHPAPWAIAAAALAGWSFWAAP